MIARVQDDCAILQNKVEKVSSWWHEVSEDIDVVIEDKSCLWDWVVWVYLFECELTFCLHTLWHPIVEGANDEDLLGLDVWTRADFLSFEYHSFFPHFVSSNLQIKLIAHLV